MSRLDWKIGTEKSYCTGQHHFKISKILRKISIQIDYNVENILVLSRRVGMCLGKITAENK